MELGYDPNVVENLKSWKNLSYRLTDSQKHDSDNFLYLVSGLSRKGENKEDIESILARDPYDFFKDGKTFEYREKVCASLISQDKRLMWSKFGIIFDIPYENIGVVSPFNLGPERKGSSREELFNKSNFSVEDVLSQTRNMRSEIQFDSYGIVIKGFIENSNENKRGTVEYSNLKSIARIHGLPYVVY